MTADWITQAPTYTLTADLGDQHEERTFVATDTFDATMTAIREVMNAAYEAPDDSPWRFGRIELRAEDGTVLHTMDEKERDDDGA